MSSSIPKQHKALVYSGNKDDPVKVATTDLPKLNSEDEDVLIKVKAVTLNPTDWKHSYGGRLPEGVTIGSDFAGEVAKGAGGFKEGERVASFTRGGVINKVS